MIDEAELGVAGARFHSHCCSPTWPIWCRGLCRTRSRLVILSVKVIVSRYEMHVCTAWSIVPVLELRSILLGRGDAVCAGCWEKKKIMAKPLQI